MLFVLFCVVCWLLFVVYSWFEILLCVADDSLLLTAPWLRVLCVDCCLSLIVCCLSCVVGCVLLVMCRVLSVVCGNWWLLSVVCRVLCDFCHLLVVVCCWLVAACLGVGWFALSVI